LQNGSVSGGNDDRTGAVNPAGAAQTSAEWLEAVLEGNVRSVAGGLGQYVQGFEGNYGSPGYAYTNAYRDGLDYLQRLMRAAAAIDDPGLQPQMRDAKFLSHLVNLGGAYAGLNPNRDGQIESFLDAAWSRGHETSLVADKLKREIANVEHLSQALSFTSRVLLTLKQVPALNTVIHNAEILGAFVSEAILYSEAPPGDAMFKVESFWSILWESDSPAGITQAAGHLQTFLESNQLLSKSALKDWLLTYDTSDIPISNFVETLIASSTTSNLSPDPCLDLLEKLKYVVNDLKKRSDELLEDYWNLQHGHWSLDNPKYVTYSDGVTRKIGSVESHQDEFRRRQRNLDKKMNRWRNDKCGDKTGKPLPKDVLDWQKAQAPNPLPKPASPVNRQALPRWVQALGVTLVTQTAVVGGGITIMYVPESVKFWGPGVIALLVGVAEAFGATFRWQY
jgi:hypothetical protein